MKDKQLEQDVKGFITDADIAKLKSVGDKARDELMDELDAFAEFLGPDLGWVVRDYASRIFRKVPPPPTE